VTVVAAAGSNFADRAFAGCSRGMATQSPWLTGPPGATLGCVYAQEYRFAPGRHYLLRYGRIEALPGAGPPADLVAVFALPEVGLDIRSNAACARAP
jgi:S-methylmethionine-dependent homocysteine/selenocysteine methylase